MQEGTNSSIYTPENIKAVTGATFTGTGFVYLDIDFTYVLLSQQRDPIRYCTALQTAFPLFISVIDISDGIVPRIMYFGACSQSTCRGESTERTR